MYLHVRVRVQGLPEQISKMVAASISTKYQETFRVTVLPAFERNCAEMMKQIDDNFRRGTADCESSVVNP